MVRVIPMSKCPHCGARGVKRFEPLTMDGGYQVDVPYCGVCGKNYPPDEPVPAEKVTDIEDFR